MEHNANEMEVKFEWVWNDEKKQIGRTRFIDWDTPQTRPAGRTAHFELNMNGKRIYESMVPQ